MLRELYIKNVAVIEDVHIRFKDGLNVLTGETGAGKSIIIDSINMILGERSSRDIVRHNADKARVQAVFDVSDDVVQLCDEFGVDCDDETVILSRDISIDGKSTARINGMVVPVSVMKTLASMLVNIHGQHDSQALLSPAKHIDFVDEYAKNATELENYLGAYNKLKGIKSKIQELTTAEREKADRVELLNFQINEIRAANLIEDEEKDLISIRDEILNAEKITRCGENAYNLLYGSDGDNCAYDAISCAISSLENVAEYSSTLTDALNGLNEAKYAIEDAAHSIRNYTDTVEYDKEALDAAEQRLDLIGDLKRKYGGDISYILEYYEKASQELAMFTHMDRTIEELTQQQKQAEADLEKFSAMLSESRKKAILSLNEKITSALHELNMDKAEFNVIIEQTDYSSTGVDNVEFYIKTNAGDSLKPLTKIASGGELSRTMLALKSVLSDNVDTMIFDEIDTGVSGLAAKKIAFKLFEISNNKQVLCITHLPQIASMSDHHFLIEKNTVDDTVKTSVNELDVEGKILEVARLSGGDVTSASTAHAKELIDSCDAYKRRVEI